MKVIKGSNPRTGVLGATLLCVALSCAIEGSAGVPSIIAVTSPTPFERQAWLKDYEFMKVELERTYANLAWFASPLGGVDLPSLDQRTKRALNTAENDEDARAAILGFIAGFHDGHLSQVATLQPAIGTTALPPPKPSYEDLSAIQACVALGYSPDRRIAFSLPFENLRGCSLLSDGVSRVFRASIGISSKGTRVGIVRIPEFSDRNEPPDICIREWTAQKKLGQGINFKALRAKIAQAWFQALADQLKQFKKEGVAAVIVDVGANPGGDDSGDWAARLFTSREVHSARLLMTASSAAAGYFDEQLQDLHKALDRHSEAGPQARAAVQTAIAAFEHRKASIEARKCDMSWVWSKKRPWNPTGFTRLVEAGFASGQMNYLPVGAIGDQEMASTIYWAAKVDALRGAWSGPVYVLTDGKTASSAEMFTAVMKDNGIAKVVGTPTVGAGGGFMFDEPPLELPYSRLRFRVPNCMRLRADGTDEVAGIKPDLPVLPMQGEDPRARAARVLDTIDADLRKALKIENENAPPPPLPPGNVR